MQCELPITGVGAIASVGRSAHDICASIRAGLARAQPLDYFTSVDPDSQENVPVNGHPVVAFNEGFLLFGAWQRLARAALDDLLSWIHIPVADLPAFWQRTALMCVLPELDEERFQSDSEDADSVIRERFFLPLAHSRGIAPDNPGNAVFCGGHAGFATLLQRVPGLLADAGIDRVVVLGVDSYLDTPCLEWLDANFRLKSGQAPTGLAPGEAAACVMFESAAAADARRGNIAANVTAVAKAQDCGADTQDAAQLGRGLADVLRANLGSQAPARLDLLCDQNGEVWRALQLSYARMRVDTLTDVAVNIATPFASTGDVGAAWGPLATAFAVHGFRRGMSHSASIIATASSEGGAVGAWTMSRPAAA